jgi:hypothetical protein
VAVASLIISIIAGACTAWNAAYRYRDDARGRWWDRLTWALERYSADTAHDADRELYWDILTYHLTTAPARRNRDDQAMLDAMRRWLRAIVNDNTTAYTENTNEQE